MKFGKELASQMVPEWKEAYMNYDDLKKLLKEILIFRQQNAVPPSGPIGGKGPLRRLTMYRTFSGLTNRYTSLKGSPKKSEDEAIIVSAVQQEGSSECVYQTMFLKSSEEGGELELLFFRRLDSEFNKVVKFYKKKVQEVEVEADELSRQMNALIALRYQMEKPNVEQKTAIEAGLGTSFNESAPSSAKGPKSGPLDVIHEVEMGSEENSMDEHMRIERRRKYDELFRPASLDVLSQVTINVDPATPVSTLRNVVMNSCSKLSYDKDELRAVEKKLTLALVEFYQQLRFLKSFCFLNILAFSKILKKYDKITSRNASKSYLKMVDDSYLGSSDEITKLIERLESTFIKHFSNGNRRKGMKSLRPKHKKDRHRTTFFLGLFTGCSIALVVAIIVAIHMRNLLNNEERGTYMNTIFQLYSLFGYIVLHMIMYGANTYFWKRYSVNYPFIMGLKPGTELGFREIFLAASGLSVLALAATLANLDMEMDERTLKYTTLTELVPLFLIAVVFLITFIPFNIVYRSSRFFFVQSSWRCLCAPLYKVVLFDSFLADQLTSQIQAFRCFLFYFCYYVFGDFTTRSTQFRSGKTYEILYIVVVIIPFGARVLQCLRRMFEEKNSMHAFNCLKYFSTIVAVVARTIFQLRRNPFWRIIAASTSGFTTIYNTYWDIVIDWGLLRRDAKNPFLREKLLVPHKSVYVVAIIVNILLRLVWMQLILDIQVSFLHRKVMIALVACLEILRRGIWNFFRLENEHLNNVGRYRAFKSVPLPFHYADGKIM